MAKSFISVIDQTLSEIDAWNSEVSQAWVQLFQWITFGLGKGMYKSIIGLVPTKKNTDGCFLIELKSREPFGSFLTFLHTNADSMTKLSSCCYQLSHEVKLSCTFIRNFVRGGIHDVMRSTKQLTCHSFVNSVCTSTLIL